MSDWITAAAPGLAPRWPVGSGVAGSVLFLCTGNATRSVLAGAALSEARPDLRIDTAGTLSIDGLPMSWRTRAAFDNVGLRRPHHASKQAVTRHLAAADLIIGLAPEHVEWVRREHAGFASRTATLINVVQALPYTIAPLSQRVAELSLADHVLAAHEEVVDPGGGEVDAFVACAREIVALIERLAPVL